MAATLRPGHRQNPPGCGFPAVRTDLPPTMSNLNYRHLHYFWIVAKDGGFARAAERLDMAVQTITA